MSPACAVHPETAIVLMDCQMPILDGYQATQKLRQEEPYVSKEHLADIPIIAVSI